MSHDVAVLGGGGGAVLPPCVRVCGTGLQETPQVKQPWFNWLVSIQGLSITFHTMRGETIK